MSRVLLTLVSLTAGTAVFCAFRQSTIQFRYAAEAGRNVRTTETQRLEQTRSKCTELNARVQELKKVLLSRTQVDADLMFARATGTNGPIHLAVEQREKLLSELGFDWKSTGDYLVVSKETLRHIGVPVRGAHDNRLTDAVCGVLALTPDERVGVESLLSRVATDYDAWAVAHVQRTEPESDVVAKYTMPVDAQFSAALSNTLSTGVFAVLGPERGGLLLQYGGSWIHDFGMDTYDGQRVPITMTLTRKPDSRLGLELSSAGGVMKIDLLRPEFFPETFRSIFPGGWPDLAKREGFELPKNFEKQ